MEHRQINLEQGQEEIRRDMRGMEKRLIGEINLQIKYVLDDLEKTEKRILSQINEEALIM